MSGTYQDQRLRLVPLVSTLASISKPRLGLDQVFELAIKGEIRLYVPVPTGKVAYVDQLLPIVVHNWSSRYFMGGLDLCRYSPLSHQIHPEIAYVALDPDQAEDLKTNRLTHNMAFASGLSLHPDSKLALAKWWAPCEFRASIVICPAPPESHDEKKRQFVRRNMLKTTPTDIYIDEHVAALLEFPQISIDEDPLYLRKRAPGVFALYKAAQDFCEPLKKAKKLEEVRRLKSKIKAQLIREVSELYNTTNVDQAVKLIDPKNKRGSGVPKQNRRDFDFSLLASSDIRTRYMHGEFVNDALALILYATDWWSIECKMHDAAKEKDQLILAERPPITRLTDELERLGFYGRSEIDAITEIVMWTGLRVRLAPKRRGSS